MSHYYQKIKGKWTKIECSEKEIVIQTQFTPSKKPTWNSVKNEILRIGFDSDIMEYQLKSIPIKNGCHEILALLKFKFNIDIINSADFKSSFKNYVVKDIIKKRFVDNISSRSILRKFKIEDRIRVKHVINQAIDCMGLNTKPRNNEVIVI